MSGKGPFGMRLVNCMDPKGSRRFLLDMLPKNSIGAEIGVSIGNFSQAILQIVEPKRLYLVDPWEEYNDHLYSGGRTQEQFDVIADFVADRFKDRDNVEIRRKRSDQFLIETVDDFFDWIYVDGDHTFGPCMLDILLSIPKVKVGGYLCGDDYEWAPELGRPVMAAVKTISMHDKRLKLIQIKNGQWVFERVK